MREESIIANRSVTNTVTFKNYIDSILISESDVELSNEFWVCIKFEYASKSSVCISKVVKCYLIKDYIKHIKISKNFVWDTDFILTSDLDFYVWLDSYIIVW